MFIYLRARATPAGRSDSKMRRMKLLSDYSERPALRCLRVVSRIARGGRGKLAGFAVLVLAALPAIEACADQRNASASPSDPPIVYVRVPRATEPVTLRYEGKTYDFRHADVWDRLPDVTHNTDGFNAEGQLVLRQPDGQETIIYDCTGKPCTPLDPMPSLDGSKIAFAVYRSRTFGYRRAKGERLPNRYISAENSESQIYIYDIDSDRLTAWPRQRGVHDNSPIFLKNNRIMFASDRAGFYGPALRPGRSPRVMQLFTARADGSKAKAISPHQVSNAQHPFLLSSGRVVFGEQWLAHSLPYFYNNGTPGMFTTKGNTWVVSDMDQLGGDATTLLGGHRNRFRDYKIRELKALHFLGELDNGDICTANYYRGNNSGLGMVLCWPPEPYSIEGNEPAFLPRGIYSLATWTTFADNPSSRIDGEFGGKLGFPEGHPDGVLVTRGRGYCKNHTTQVPALIKRLKDQVGCDAGLYLVTSIPSRHPDDLQVVVDSPEWHEFNARVVRSRTVAPPRISRSSNGSCLVGSSNAGVTDAHDYTPEDEYRFNNRFKAMSNHGTELRGSAPADVVAIRFYAVKQNRSRNPRFTNTVGNRLFELGDVPLLEDGSFIAELPCNVPYVMAGVNEMGLVIKRDQLPQSLRPGEKKTCMGCHLHGKEARRNARPFDESLASSSTPFQLLERKPILRYATHIKPMLRKNCAGCHASDWVPLFNYEKLVWDHWQSALPEARRAVVAPHRNGNRRYALNRPNTSKYVNSVLGLESLLYWKAAGRRMDGRSDATYADDIDFGDDHPAALNSDELELLARWLDSGATR